MQGKGPSIPELEGSATMASQAAHPQQPSQLEQGRQRLHEGGRRKVFEVLQGTIGHAMLLPAAAAVPTTAITWAKTHSLLVLLLVSIGSSAVATLAIVAAWGKQQKANQPHLQPSTRSEVQGLLWPDSEPPPTIEGVSSRVRGPRLWPAAVIAILVAWGSLGFALHAIVERLPKDGYVTSSHDVFVARIRDVARPRADAARTIGNITFRLRELLSRSGTSIRGFRVVWAVADNDGRVLRAMSPLTIQGEPLDTADREYPIPTAAPDSPTSVAGVAYRRRDRQYVPDGSKSKIYKSFGDLSDTIYRPSLTVLSISICDPGHPELPPLGVLSVSSPEPNALTPYDFELIDQEVDVLISYLLKADNPRPSDTTSPETAIRSAPKAGT